MVYFKDSTNSYMTNITDSLSQKKLHNWTARSSKMKALKQGHLCFSPNCPQAASIFLQLKQKKYMQA